MTTNCLYCGKSIPKDRIDSIGRRLTKDTKYCSKNCRNYDIIKKNPEKTRQYMHNYYITKIKVNKEEN
jgi:predicted nucleic acid-binding Zn ribbon protein